eukprot:4195737-Pyramimonas_sp.AAC.1
MQPSIGISPCRVDRGGFTMCGRGAALRVDEYGMRRRLDTCKDYERSADGVFLVPRTVQRYLQPARGATTPGIQGAGRDADTARHAGS